MKNFIIILILSFCNTSTNGQINSIFEIEIINTNDSTLFKSINDFEKRDSAFFEDELYYVRRTCRGEFGGSIWFRNKKTGVEYGCEATCPVSINKVGDAYIVTAALTHFHSYSSVFEIRNPNSMEISKGLENQWELNRRGNKKRKWSWNNFRFVAFKKGFHAGDRESKSQKGKNIIIDTMGVHILMSFPYQEQLFHIIKSEEALYLFKLEHNRLVTIDTIFNGLDTLNMLIDDINYNYSTKNLTTKDNSRVVLFENMGLVAYLEIKGNKITFTHYR